MKAVLCLGCGARLQPPTLCGGWYRVDCPRCGTGRAVMATNPIEAIARLKKLAQDAE